MCPLCSRPTCRPEALSNGFRYCVVFALGYRIDGTAVELVGRWFPERPRVTWTTLREVARVKS